MASPTSWPAQRDRKSTRLNSSPSSISYSVFFFNDTATTEIYTLSLHDALPILKHTSYLNRTFTFDNFVDGKSNQLARAARSEEHTSELQSQFNLVFGLFF